MKKFIYKLLYFFLMTCGFMLIVDFIYVGPNDSNYMAAIVDKHKRLGEMSDGRVIFAGGSNLAFGLNSERIENEINNITVVNLGLHAGLGMEFLIGEVRSSVKDGDVVFLSFEYLIGEGQSGVLELTAECYPESKKYVNNESLAYSDFKLYLDSVSDKFRSIVFDASSRKRVQLKDPIYSRLAFNEFGDHTAHLERGSIKILIDNVVLSYRYWEEIERLNELNKICKERNVKLYFSYPCIAESFYEKNQSVIDRFENDISNDLRIPVVNHPRTFVYPDNHFYDTVYHLNSAGRDKRTETFIKIIKSDKVRLN